MTDTLVQLFSSAARVRLLRLFLFNPRSTFTLSDVVTRAQVLPKEARRELNLLQRAKIIEKSSRRNTARYWLTESSPYTETLQNLLLNTPTRSSEMYNRLRSVGALKLIVVAGMFMNEWDHSIDLLVVGDRIKERALLRKVKQLEAEVGKEVRFTAMSTPDFYYRLNMSDRLLRDIFDFPHKVVLDRLDIGLK